MGSGEALKAAKIYRGGLMKAVKKHIGKEEHKTHFTDFIKSEFRKTGDGLETLVVQQKMNLARDYTYLLNSVHHHQDLLFSYNIAVDRSDKMKKILGKSAAWVSSFPRFIRPNCQRKEDIYGIECFLSINNDDKAQKLLVLNVRRGSIS